MSRRLRRAQHDVCLAHKAWRGDTVHHTTPDYPIRPSAFVVIAATTRLQALQ